MDITTDFSEEKVQEDSCWVLSCCLKHVVTGEVKPPRKFFSHMTAMLEHYCDCTSNLSRVAL